MPDFLELAENQSRQYIDAQALVRAQGEALEDAAQVRGSMIWRELRGVLPDSYQRRECAKNHWPR